MSTKELLFSYFKRKWMRYVGGLLFVFVSTWFTMRVPRLLGEVIDLLTEGAELSDVKRAALSLALTAAGGFLFRFTWRYLVLGFTRGAETYMRRCIFAHLEKLSADFYLKFNTGDIITRGISDVLGIRRMFGGALVSLIDASIIFSLSAVNMLDTADIAMAAAAILPIPLLLFFILKIRKNLRARQRDIRAATSAMASKIQENLTGIRVIKAFAREHGESERVQALSDERRASELRRVRLSAIIGPLIRVVYAIVFTIFIVYGSRLIMEGSMTVGNFTAFNGYILLMMGPIAIIGRAVEDWQTGMASIARLDEILLSKPSVEDRPGLAEEWEQRRREGRDPFVETAAGSDFITIKNLSFTYPASPPGTPPVLRELSFSIKRGETIAITGPIGSGKSTLMSLLSRLWAVNSGDVTVGGVEVGDIPVSVLRDATGYVPQDNFLFSESILENIRFFADGVTEEDVRDAARAVSVDRDITEFSQGYETVVGERGVTLSGGQMQRISIARALVRRPQILLLDDCLSAVDAETERAIIGGLRGYLDGATAVIVTHRVAAAALADRIIVLSADGRITEMGTYDELMEKRGEFWNLAEMQTGAGEEAAE